jgi:DNA-binding cell septation regulator SpoVG
MAKLPRFEVMSLTPLVQMGALRAYAEVRIAGKFTISALRLIEPEGGCPWVSGPQTTWVDADGRQRYSTLITFHEKEWRAALTAAVLEAYRDHPEGIRQQSSCQKAGLPAGGAR